MLKSRQRWPTSGSVEARGLVFNIFSPSVAVFHNPANLLRALNRNNGYLPQGRSVGWCAATREQRMAARSLSCLLLQRGNGPGYTPRTPESGTRVFLRRAATAGDSHQVHCRAPGRRGRSSLLAAEPGAPFHFGVCTLAFALEPARLVPPTRNLLVNKCRYFPQTCPSSFFNFGVIRMSSRQRLLLGSKRNCI